MLTGGGDFPSACKLQLLLKALPAVNAVTPIAATTTISSAQGASPRPLYSFTAISGSDRCICCICCSYRHVGCVGGQLIA